MSQRKDGNGRRLINDFYTLGEEIANSITHGIGAAFSIAALTTLVIYAYLHGDPWRLASFSIYGSTLIILYVASTLYHSIQHPRVKHILRIIDHAAIYLLIAGTYTPFLLVSLRGRGGWTLLALVWGVAALGVGFKLIFIHRFEILSTLAYILMGWLGVVYWREILTHVPSISLIWLAVGGALYTVGVIFYALQRLPYNHAIWHLFVMGGSLCHFVAVFYLLPVA